MKKLTNRNFISENIDVVHDIILKDQQIELKNVVETLNFSYE